ncbi:redoxin domain-containing protein [Streptomyces sp. NPDC001415]
MSLNAELREITTRAGQELADSGRANRALPLGERAPGFFLTTAIGEPVTLDSLVADGPVVLTFCRGAWCPYCNLALRALQQHHVGITARDAQPVAVSPQITDKSLPLSVTPALAFPALSYLGSGTARHYGLTCDLTNELAALYGKLGFDLQHVSARRSVTAALTRSVSVSTVVTRPTVSRTASANQ